MAGFVAEYLPIPQRHMGNGMTIRVPSFNLPPDVMTLEDARAYVAKKFKVDVDCVFKLGESYFTHIGVTPHRIYPFAVAAKSKSMVRKGTYTDYAPIRHLWKMHYFMFHDSELKAFSQAVVSLRASGHDLGLNWDWDQEIEQSLLSTRPNLHDYSDIPYEPSGWNGGEDSGSAQGASDVPVIGDMFGDLGQAKESPKEAAGRGKSDKAGKGKNSQRKAEQGEAPSDPSEFQANPDAATGTGPAHQSNGTTAKTPLPPKDPKSRQISSWEMNRDEADPDPFGEANWEKKAQGPDMNRSPETAPEFHQK